MGTKKEASRRKYHFLYKTICLITGKHYYGMHSTDRLDDGYFGSGKILRYSINKYGKENHIREIFGEMFPDRESLREAEEKLIDKNKLKDPKCMNLQVGGSCGPDDFGGWNKGKSVSEITRKRQAEAHKGKKLSDEQKLKISLGNKGRQKTVEERAKISQSKKDAFKRLGYVPGLISGAHNGHKLTDEHKQKLYDAVKGRKQSKEEIEKRVKTFEAKRLPKPEAKLCACGCEKYASVVRHGRNWFQKDFVRGHHMKLSDFRKKLSSDMMGNKIALKW